MTRSASVPAAGLLAAPDLPLLAELLRTAAAAPPADAVPEVLEVLRARAGLDACSVWTAGPDGPVRRWGAGAAFGERAAAGAPGALPVGDGPVATLVLTPPPAEPGRWQPVADLLAPLVGRAEGAAAASNAAASGARDDEARPDAAGALRLVECVVDALPVGVYVVDRGHAVRLWNRKREVGTQGVSRAEAIGRPIFEVLPRQDAALMRRELDEVFATGRAQQLMIESHSTGEPRTYRLTRFPIRLDEASDLVSHVVTIGEDVTEWKAAVERSAQAEKLAALGQLAAGVMHEINNPLATIAACAETMALTLADLPRERQPAGFGEYLRIVDHEVHRCRRIIEGLLDFSRARPIERAPVSVNAVVERTLLLVKHHARFRRSPIHLDLAEGDGPTVVADADQIVQVLMALLLNAADAVAARVGEDGDEMPSVTLRTRVRGASALLEVEDEGTGIPRAALSKIFEPFYTTKPVGKGTGLGLAICFGIVRDHGGEIEVDSEPGVGSTFRVVLPAVDAAPVELAAGEG